MRFNKARLSTGLRIHYAESVDARGIPVVFVHGLARGSFGALSGAGVGWKSEIFHRQRGSLRPPKEMKLIKPGEIGASRLNLPCSPERMAVRAVGGKLVSRMTSSSPAAIVPATLFRLCGSLKMRSLKIEMEQKRRTVFDDAVRRSSGA
jgi:hypothetical protein